MTLSDVSIRRPVFTTMISVCLVVLGVMGLSRLGTDFFPDVSLPVVVVTTVYKGAGPSEIETQVTKPLEDSVAGISGVDAIHSFSRENVSIVVVMFKLSTSLDRAVEEVRDKVSAVSHLLPRQADAPTVGRVDVGASPLITYAASANWSSQELRQQIKERLEPALAQIEGVADVRVTGGDVREIRVDIDLDKAKAAGIAPGQIAEKVGMENLNLPAGRLELGPSELTVRSIGEYRSVDDLRALPIAKSQSGSQVRLDEIAEVSDAVAERRTVARLNGTEAIIVDVVKQPGSNTIWVADEVKKKMAEMEPVLGNGFHARPLVDQSLLVRANAHEVYIALVFGGLMAVLIILIFLLDLRGTFISSLALPTSVIGTFFVMYVLGYTLNQMTLLALSLAIGLLIDDAVVVREAITHRLELGEPPRSAASKGTRDVYLAVLATTLSLVAVFVPVAFMPGIVGQFFKQFGITISAAVIISLFISFTLDPMLSARLAKQRRPGEQRRRESLIPRTLRAWFVGMERGYERILRWVLANRGWTSVITVAVLALSVFGARNLRAEFVPQEDRSQFMIDLQLGDGASLSEATVRTATAEEVLRHIPEVQDVYSIVGFNGDVNKTRMRVLTTDKSKRVRGIQSIKEEARLLLTPALPATQIALLDPPQIEGAGDFFPIMVRVMGPDLDQVKQESERIAGILRELSGTADVRVEANPPKPELQVIIDRARASDVDLSSVALAMQLRLAMNGETVTKLRQGNEEVDVVVRLATKDRSSPEAIGRMDIFTPKGVRAISDIATLSTRDGPSVIEHHNRQRSIAVLSGLGKDAALGTIAGSLRSRLAAEPVRPGYSVFYDGQVKTFDEQNAAFAMAISLAFVFIYMVLASQFESFKHPFTIMVSLPLALVGAMLGLVLGGFNVSLSATIGIILLMGLVTKNAILLVDGALQNLRAGDDLNTALLKAGPRRLRPILMTSAAMAIGMVPTALGKGMGSEFRAPMAVAVIGGVITSTFLTLLVVPVVFSFFENLTPRALRIGKQIEEEPEVSSPSGSPAPNIP
jgi:HAE1 family hydrophobic/amphiphilic exporter-1